MELLKFLRLLIYHNVHNGWIHYENIAYHLEMNWDWGRWNAEVSHRNSAWRDAHSVIAAFDDDSPF